ncbi:MAG: hypothetical protein M1824_005852 [Vezdaea acicularis]|nr:MAG: hypothetical protein M1824_005852 [Vezdaea acicularis]
MQEDHHLHRVSYAWTQALYLSLPISVLAGFTACLPVVSSISVPFLEGLHRMLPKTNSGAYVIPNYVIPVVKVLILIYTIVVATLTITYLAPDDVAHCRLETQWQHMFVEGSQVIKRIQDARQCCGFNSAVDRAWPLVNQGHPRHKPDECRKMFERDLACVGPWTSDMKLNASLLLFVAVATFFIKLAIQYFQAEERPHHQVHGYNRQIGGVAGLTHAGRPHLIDAPVRSYTDNPSEDEEESDNSRGPRVLPSGLGETDAPWRGEETQHV